MHHWNVNCEEQIIHLVSLKKQLLVGTLEKFIAKANQNKALKHIINRKVYRL